MLMATRKIVKIDEEKCTGCGLCIPNCPEGAIQIIDGKARLVSDIFCDGLVPVLVIVLKEQLRQKKEKQNHMMKKRPWKT